MTARWIGRIFAWSLVAVMLGLFAISSRKAREDARKISCSNNLKQIGLALHTYHDAYNQFPPNGLYFSTEQSKNPFVGRWTSRGSVLVKLHPMLVSSPYYSSLDFDIAGQPWAFEKQQITLIGKMGDYQGSMKAESFEMLSFLCPSSGLDPFLDRGKSAAAVSCYAPSMGAQSMPPFQNYCLDYPGNVFGTGPAPYGLTADGREASGLFARGHWAAGLRDITAGQSQVIAFGETLPNKSFFQSRG